MTGKIVDADAVILCGGLGTRLREVIGAKQKTVAEINGRPFLFFVIDAMIRQGVRRIVLSAGYQAGDLKRIVSAQEFGAELVFVEEKEQLGTGGALRFAQASVKSDPFLVLNGDSFCPISYADLLAFHKDKKALAAVTVVQQNETADYGTVRFGADARITGFLEKQQSSFAGSGYINAGVYCLSQEVFRRMPAVEKFSLEKDFFPELCGDRFFGWAVDQPFLDIGTPARFKEAEEFLRKVSPG